MKKNILNITLTDIGGAGSLAYRYHQFFKENGHTSALLVLDKFSKDKDVIGFHFKTNLFYRFIQKIKKITGNKKELNTIPKYNFYATDETTNIFETKAILEKVPFKPDAIVLFWISDFINAKNIKELHELTNAPIFWVLTDMGPLTGGCHYAWDCLGYTKGCVNCPALENENISNKKIAFTNLEFKQQNLFKEALTFIPPTTILEKQLLQSSFRNFRYKKILLPINSGVFKPVDKKSAREYFSIPVDAKVIFIASSHFFEERKGLKYLLDSLTALREKVQKDEVLLFIAGKKAGDIIKDLPFKYIYAGELKSDEALCNAYCASDVFACPSIEDSGPMMINESILCGTPVVAFDNVGVANDLVETGKTGYRAILKDAIDFAKGLYYILNLNETDYLNMRKNCEIFGKEIMSKELFYNNNLKELFDTQK